MGVGMLKILKLSSRILMFQEIFCSTLLITLLTFLGFSVALIVYPLLACTRATRTFLENIKDMTTDEINKLQDVYKRLKEQQ